MEQIDEMDSWEGSQLNRAKEILAWELTKMVHGEEEADKAQNAAKALFAGAGDRPICRRRNCRRKTLPTGRSASCICSLPAGCASNGEARRLVQQGGVSVNDAK